MRLANVRRVLLGLNAALLAIALLVLTPVTASAASYSCGSCSCGESGCVVGGMDEDGGVDFYYGGSCGSAFDACVDYASNGNLSNPAPPDGTTVIK